VTVKLNSLQALRGLAAVTVVVSHLMRQTHQAWVGAPVPDLRASALGYLGVLLFFIISGFVMQYTAGGTFGQPGAARQFFERRIVRIVPLYWAFTALAVAFPGAVYLGARNTAMGIISSFIFLPTPVLAVGWTLSFEMLFYLVFAICLNFQRRTGVAILITGLFAFFLLMKGIGPALPALSGFAQWWSGLLSAWFIMGVLFAIVRERCDVKGQQAMVGFAAAVLLFSATVLRTMFVFDTVGIVLLVLVPMAVVAFCTFQGDAPDSGLMRPLIWLGDRSYTLYLGHLFVLGTASAAWLRLFGANWSLAYDAATLGLCVLLCSPVYRLEVRLTKFARRLLSQYERPQAPLRAAANS
jgi:exopolysaccharide production protein ExoZ